MKAAVVRPLMGVASVALVIGLVALSATFFRDGFAESVPLTVLSPRAGLVMNPDAKVQIHGVQIGKVEAIDDLPDGRAAIRLSIEPRQADVIPANVNVHIASTTVFGAKVIRLIPPEHPSEASIQPGQVLDTDRVMLEVNTLFEQLVSVLSTVQPEKLSETLGAIAAAVNGRGDRIGTALQDLNSALAKINPHLDALNHDLATAPGVLAAYADAAPDLLTVADNAATLSRTVVDRQDDLDTLLVSLIGLGDVGTPVLEQNRQPLADVLRLLTPVTTLTDDYRGALTCGLQSLNVMSNNGPLNVPGVEVLAGFFWGQERYRYPADLPKVAATGGPQCTDLPAVPYGKAPPFVIADTGANPWKYNNRGIVLNSDLLKQILFGPQDGPPRNSAQIGQPG
ncbi:MCE family protein [Mycolicibacterium arseniciresistens]|uniref:MCE family protein n=1 Tax=Mycolicibacterium arseniciresistens TaxID=3062257 RepID=A0ABT8US05_9MYCO|nr:MCE family protein [Mycolicibacterium arseniciresistens]MDO3639807.1 MCE family protein [Mycolicibacterium arseniciresistens]